jgi:uncharacterized protein (DUF1800 family)
MVRLTDRERVAHLLRRFGLGASEAELDYYGKDGWKSAVDKLLNNNSIPSGFDVDPQIFANGKAVVNLKVIQAHWHLRLIATQHPLEEKLTIFWHNHFATSSQKVENSYVMFHHIDTLRTNALGKFSDLLLAVSQDPAMIYWLDNQLNVKGKPNENFAREVMELFTLGVDNYSERDVQEAARAFTGWGYGTRLRRSEGSPKRFEKFIYSEERHDSGIKEVLNKRGPLNGDDVVKILCEMPSTAEFIARKMWKFFASPSPDDLIIKKLAEQFFSSGLDIKVLVRAIMESEEFYSEKCIRKLVKNPIDFIVSTVRQLGVGSTAMEQIKDGVEFPLVNEQSGVNLKLVRALGSAFAVNISATSQGMELMSPPDVSGWGTGSYWVSSATMVERSKWSNSLFRGGYTGAAPGLAAGVAGRRAQGVSYDAWNLFSENPTPEFAVQKLLSVFDVSLPTEKRQLLFDAAQLASRGGITEANANNVARAISKLIFGSPEFQFA